VGRIAGASSTPWPLTASNAPFAYELIAVTIEQGKFKSSIETLGPRLRDLGIEWVRRGDPSTLALVAGGVAHGCDVCSRHRRRALYQVVGELLHGAGLGHTGRRPRGVTAPQHPLQRPHRVAAAGRPRSRVKPGEAAADQPACLGPTCGSGRPAASDAMRPVEEDVAEQ